jgi:excisionase family DNA binding protein
MEQIISKFELEEDQISSLSNNTLGSKNKKSIKEKLRYEKDHSSKKSQSDWLTVEDVTLELKVSTSQVYQWIDKGMLDAFNVGTGSIRNNYRIRRNDLDRFLESKKVAPLPTRSRSAPTYCPRGRSEKKFLE